MEVRKDSNGIKSLQLTKRKKEKPNFFSSKKGNIEVKERNANQAIEQVRHEVVDIYC